MEILPDIEVSFLRPNGGNNEYIFRKSVHICKLCCKIRHLCLLVNYHILGFLYFAF